ncbi:cyclin-dependent kinase G-2-like isoform X2 [Magnolia sinica]|uniref:cyclin-dependent kinase G-2-like isoform X2 n=1 Tax=Magnolia sinica TaxID=86752 RepID=UPI002658DE18|nr:cyclin-dependent kinase G-2-like isoform X2 [Magnolia sinica]
MWSLGCIMAELLAKEPLFNGKTEFDQIDKIFRTLGTPSAKIWPEFVELPGVKVNFVKQLLPAMGDAGQAFWFALLAIFICADVAYVWSNH